ncbi:MULTISPECIES: iron chelate uptake ABC transporter family permease subunit [unclassified Paracoccus (in: a-proteobacteria)]|uniref:iron chelate uptake ABC transporter family permease subunit n=1 Tax=unclassified Paracoccus (in: a-proteobacteria) TaxID=2688777 RepID=UPI0012B3436F|nr:MULTISPECIES: iron chelate uptake ABC transporter family permease subunit [unclassified Paracoccus (in: a-proteobacteria)]UXU75004.1 metal ABC transporter permease [Paracoccus sp. SMMA_5]UXU80907.1 metal ABC transporter permease [Paracoccus sp. SMMA_5_TC]
MFDDFLTRALLAGLGLVLATGPLGCFVVWRRMAYFGDSTAHAAILGVALSFAFAMPIYLGTVAVAIAMAVLVAQLGGRGQSTDTVLGVLAHGALALGLVAASLVPSLRSGLDAFLFGDILAVTRADLAWIWCGAGLVLALLIWRWQRLVTSSVNEELAMAAGINPARERLILSLALALVVAIAIRVVGALLVSAMLIVPAAAARGFARTPEQMAGSAILFGGLAVFGGLWASLALDTPAGPSIVVAALVIYVASIVVYRK